MAGLALRPGMLWVPTALRRPEHCIEGTEVRCTARQADEYVRAVESLNVAAGVLGRHFSALLGAFASIAMAAELVHGGRGWAPVRVCGHLLRLQRRWGSNRRWGRWGLSVWELGRAGPRRRRRAY